MATDTENITLGSFGQGCFVNVKYTAPTDASRIIVNLLSDKNTNIHVNPRYDQKELVLNTKSCGNWDQEERPSCFPICPGQATQVTVEAGCGAFNVCANETEFAYQFKYRQEVTEVKQIQAIGNGTELETSVGRVLPNYSDCKVVCIHGRAPCQGTFVIDFVPSIPSDYQSQTIAFHMSIRFAGCVVVRNTRSNTGWGQEERDGGFPFTAGKDFIVTVVGASCGFKVAVNGCYFTEYKYRLPQCDKMSVSVHGLPHLDKLEYF